MMVNPVGVQMDMLNSASSFEDLAPDWIWDSAGRRTPSGYSVEIRLPLREHPLQGRRQRPHGHSLLASRQPQRGVGVVARE